MNVLRNTARKIKLKTCHDIRLKGIFIRRYGNKKFGRKEDVIQKALSHFDDLYGGIFKIRWHSIRLGLLSQPKHVALLNNFSDVEETEQFLKYDGALDLKKLLNDEFVLKRAEDESLTKLFEDSAENENVTSEALEENEDTLKVTYPKECKAEFEVLSGSYKIGEEFEDDKNDKVKNIERNESMSLNEALSQSQIDISRMIDPSQNFDSGYIHEYVPVTELKGNEDYIPEEDYYRFYKVNTEIPLNIEKECEIIFPENLKVYSYPRGCTSSFPLPKVSSLGTYNYYPLDGASILVVLALGLEEGDRVLDMCAAPGGKTLAILQTMLPDILVCNDISKSRINRLQNVLKMYLHDYPDFWNDKIFITKEYGENYVNDKKFNKILVDVPCTTDRKSATVSENNIFKGMRIKERLRLPEYQAEILKNALRIVEPGGTVVYSTCTLSPVQNDGVVNIALHSVWRETGTEFIIKDLSPALRKMASFYRFSPDIGLKYGSMVVPFLPLNFGPMYFSKLVKKK